MRKLTIKRQKKFTGCLGKMKVYIEDTSGNGVLICDTPCKFLGTLKNGEEKTFEISEAAAKVFVIAGAASQKYCNDYYKLPEGGEDVYLTGKNVYSPMSGNPFRFDGVTDEEVLRNRKKSSGRGAVITAVCVVIGFIIGLFASGAFSEKYVTPETFECKDFSITLTEDFVNDTDLAEEMEYYAVFDSRDIAVLVLRDEFEYLEGTGVESALDYCELLCELSEIPDAEVKEERGVLHFDYTDTQDGVTDYYFTAVLESSDSYWVFQFFVEEELYPEFEDRFFEWAGSVVFK